MLKRSLIIPALALATITGGLAAGALLPPPAQGPAQVTDCEEDMPCWDCETMGNQVCGTADPDAATAWQEWDRQGGAQKLEVDCPGAFRVEFMGATDNMPQNTDALDLVLPGVTRNYIFRAACTID